MNSKEHLAEAICTLIHSWGGDTPPEAFWVLTELIKFINKEYGQNFEDLDSEEMTEKEDEKLEKVLEYLRS